MNLLTYINSKDFFHFCKPQVRLTKTRSLCVPQNIINLYYSHENGICHLLREKKINISSKAEQAFNAMNRRLLEKFSLPGI